MSVRLYINRDTNYGPWGGGAKAVNALVECCELHGFKMADEKHPPDVVLLMGMDSENGHLSLEDAARLRAGGDTPKVFLRVNDCDARKGTTNVDSRIAGALAWADGVMFVSEWVRDHLTTRNLSYGKNNHTTILNGVDRTIFRPNAFTRHTYPKTRIVSHHWSDNRMKSGEITEAVDEWVGKNGDQFEFTFIGRTKCSLPNARVVPPLAGKELGDRLREHDVYVSETRFDPGPNHVIEAIACGLPTYVHRDGGGAVEFAGLGHAYEDAADLIKILEARHMYRRNHDNYRTWDDFAHDVFNFLRT
jgi:hypothetical protein